VNALKPGFLVDLLCGCIGCGAEAVQVFKAGKEFLRIIDSVDPKFERGDIAGEELDFDRFAGGEGAGGGEREGSPKLGLYWA